MTIFLIFIFIICILYSGYKWILSDFIIRDKSIRIKNLTISELYSLSAVLRFSIYTMKNPSGRSGLCGIIRDFYNKYSEYCISYKLSEDIVLSILKNYLSDTNKKRTQIGRVYWFEETDYISITTNDLEEWYAPRIALCKLVLNEVNKQINKRND